MVPALFVPGGADVYWEKMSSKLLKQTFINSVGLSPISLIYPINYGKTFYQPMVCRRPSPRENDASWCCCIERCRADSYSDRFGQCRRECRRTVTKNVGNMQ